MTVFKIMARYFWAICILVTCLNAVILKGRSKSHIEGNPELAEGYRKLIRGYLFWMNLPWIVMGIGCIVGGVPTMFHFLRPRDANPFVIVWWAVLFVLYGLSFYWVFLCKGAETLAKYEMISYSSFGDTGHVSSPKVVKLIFLLFLAAGVVAAIAMLTTDVPVPSFE